MKKNISKLLSILLSLALTLSLSLPAFALEDTDPPLWEQMGYTSLEELLAEGWCTEEEYAQMVQSELEYQEYLQQEAANRQLWIDNHPQEVAAFDPYIYYEETYTGWYTDLYTPQEYMEFYELSEEDFYQEMLRDWVQQQIYQEAAQIALAGEKTAAGGYPDGVNVMVEGTCLTFPDVRPTVESGRTMVPLAAVMEYLGAQVEYVGQAKAVCLSLEEDSLYLYHKIGTQELTLAHEKQEGEDWSTLTGETISMDVPSAIREGRTMVPLAFFAQALGYNVYWDDYYQTAVLLDRDALAETIDQNFTLLNRVLYTITGSEFTQDGKAMKAETDLKLELTEEGKTYPIHFQGSALLNPQAVNLQMDADLSSLTDLLMEGETGSTEDALAEVLLTSILTDLKLELIYSQEESSLYLRGPVLSLMTLVEDPEAWAALPVYETFSPILPEANLTVGQLLTRDDTFYGDYFHLYEYITASAYSVGQVLGDDSFTKSGSSYTARWDAEDLDLYAPTGEDAFEATLKITPEGEKGCTFSLCLSADDGNATVDLDCSGSKSKLALKLDAENLETEDFRLELEQKMSASSQDPLTRPPEGDPIEYPMGELGVGSL